MSGKVEGKCHLVPPQRSIRRRYIHVRASLIDIFMLVAVLILNKPFSLHTRVDIWAKNLLCDVFQSFTDLSLCFNFPR